MNSTSSARLTTSIRITLAASRRVSLCPLVFLLFIVAANIAFGQSDPAQVTSVLDEEILPPNVAEFQMRSTY